MAKKTPVMTAKDILSGKGRRRKIDQAEMNAVKPKAKKKAKPKAKKKKDATQATRDAFWS